MLWLGVLPALLVLFIMPRRQGEPGLARAATAPSRAEREGTDLVHAAFQARPAAGDAADVVDDDDVHLFVLLDHVLVRDVRHLEGLQPFVFSVLLNVGGVSGAIPTGRLAETRLGRRGAATLMMAIGIAAVPLYVLTDNVWLMWAGAFLVGFFAAGSWGILPIYLYERFPTAVRASAPALPITSARRRLVHPDHHRRDAGSRHPAVDRDGVVHRPRRRPGDRDGLDGSRNARPPAHGS